MLGFAPGFPGGGGGGGGGVDTRVYFFIFVVWFVFSRQFLNQFVSSLFSLTYYYVFLCKLVFR